MGNLFKSILNCRLEDMKEIINKGLFCYKFLGRRTVLYWTTFILRCVNIVIKAVIVYLCASLVSELILGKKEEFNCRVLWMIGFELLQLGINYLHLLIDNYIQRNVTVEVKKRITSSILDVPVCSLYDYSQGKLLSVLCEDASSIITFLYILQDCLIDLLTVGLMMYLLLKINWIVLVCILVCFPFICVINKFSSKKLKVRAERIRKETDDYFTLVKKFLNHIHEIQCDKAVKMVEEHLNNMLVEAKRTTLSYNKGKISVGVVESLIEKSGSIILWLIGGSLVFLNKISYDTFISCFSYTKYLNTSLRRLASISLAIQPIIISIDRVEKIILQMLECLEKEKEKINIDEILSLSVLNLGLRYQQKSIFCGVTCGFSVPTKVAITGKNGSGKTSILKILTKKISASEGKIYINGIDIDTANYHSYIDHIAYVSNEPLIYNASLLDNIVLGVKNAQSKDTVIKICKSINLYDDVVKMPNGLETILDDKYELSAGQKKKVQIARCMYKNSRIVLMDEPEAGLDTETKTVFYRSLEMMNENQIYIVSTHDESKLYLYDQVISLD